MSVSWAPDGERLAYLASGTNGGGCFLATLTDGRVHCLTPDFRATGNTAYSGPLWSADGSRLAGVDESRLWTIQFSNGDPVARSFALDAKPIALIDAGFGRLGLLDHGRCGILAARSPLTLEAGLVEIDLLNGTTVASRLTNGTFSGGAVFTTRCAPDGGQVVSGREQAHIPGDLWLLDSGLKEERRLTHLNPHWDGLVFGHSRVVEWEAADGRSLRGALLLPPDYEPGRPLPTVVKVYGGDKQSEDVNRFGLQAHAVDNLQILATRGYAVFLPDAPLGEAAPMTDLMTAVMPGLDKIVVLAIADPKRLGIMGHSYGGYSTLAIITQTTRFQAAVASACISDLISNYAWMSVDGDAFGVAWSESGQGRMGGPPWPDPSRYHQNSPFLRLDRVTTPLLLIHGSLDNVMQSEAVFVGLRRLGREAVFARYNGERHWPGTWARANVLDYWARIIDWFDRHIAEPAPARSSQP